MKRAYLTLCYIALTITHSLSQDTFSIVAVDTATGEVGSAGASCIAGSIIVSDIIPGRAAINAQALVCIPNVNLQNGLNWMSQGLSPQQVLDSLLAKDAC